jgi:putative transposase
LPRECLLGKRVRAPPWTPSTTHPGHLWALDFQHDATTDGRELKFLNVVDEFTREALAVQVDRTIDADQTVEVLERLVAERGAPANLRADNGPELTARALREWCEASSTATAYIDPGAPWQNAWVESLNARFRDEVLDVEEFSNLAEARFLAGEEARRLQRAPSPLGAWHEMSPSRFAASWRRIGEANGSVNPGLSDGVDR